MPTAVAVVAILAAATIGYLHYRKRDVIEAVMPVTPARDDRVIPRGVRMAVVVRDSGKCQLQVPGHLPGRQGRATYDHICLMG